VNNKASSIAVTAITLPVVIFCLVAILAAFYSIIESRYLGHRLYTAVFIILKDTLNLTLLFTFAVWVMITLLHYSVFKNRLKGHDEFTVIFAACSVLTFATIVTRHYLMGEHVFPAFLYMKNPVKNHFLLATLCTLNAVAFIFRRRMFRFISFLAGYTRVTLVLAVIMVSLTLALNLLVLHSAREKRKSLPSILLISLDTLRKDHLGCYGYEFDTSPNIDAFAGESVLFSDAFSHASWTLPAHMSLFTSQYSLEHGMIKENQQLHRNRRGLLLAEVLKNSHYTNVGFTGGALLDRAMGFGEGFDMYLDRGNDFRKPFDDRIISFLEKNRRFPFFLFLHTYCIHNYYSPEKYLDMFDPGCDGTFHDWEEIKPFLLKYEKSKLEGTTEKNDLQHLVRLYDSSIRYVDDRIGFLFERLKELHMYDDLLIIITSDHGEEFGDHGHTYHGSTLFDELISVPLLIKFPGNKYGGTIVDEQVNHIDIVPTILGFLEIGSGPWMRGTSLMDLIRGEGEEGELSYAESLNKRTAKFSLRTPRYHLIYESLPINLGNETKGSFKLFDIVNDPGESLDIADLDQATLVAMKEDLQMWLKPMMPEQIGKVRRTKFGERIEDRLKALGYLQ